MKITSKIASVSALLVLGLSISTPVFAADVTSTDTTQGTVGILEGSNTSPVDPVDPEDPNHPPLDTDPDDPGNNGTGQNGPLSLDYVSDVDFGNNKFNGKQSVYHLFKLDDKRNPTTEPLTYNPWVQVTDSRNTGAGWALSVNYDEDGSFKTTGNKALIGAKLQFGTSTFDKVNADSNVSSAPTHEGTLSVSDTPADVSIADTNAGMGTWLQHFSKDDTTLTVPAGNTAGQYSATLVWTLTDAAK